MSTTQLSKDSMAKAESIVKQNMIEKLSDSTWQVQSSNKKNIYIVENTATGLYCEGDNGKPCPAWKNCFPHNCKHCQAVRILEGKEF